jgi:sugar phosphate isomerase/epimerase
MRLGISSYTYGWAVGTDENRPQGAVTALDLIARAKGFGVCVVQLCDNLPAETWEDGSVETLASRASGEGVSVEIGTRGIEPGHLRRFIRIAARLGSPILRVVVDTADNHPSPAQVVPRVAEVARELQENRVTLAIENHDRFTADTLAGIVSELRERGVPVGVCLDTANSFGALEGPRVVVPTLAEYTVNLHVKDFAVRRVPYLQGFTVEGRPAGEGMLDVPWLLGELRRFGRDLSAIVELWTPPGSDTAATIRKEAEWAERSVRAMRQWVND